MHIHRSRSARRDCVSRQHHKWFSLELHAFTSPCSPRFQINRILTNLNPFVETCLTHRAIQLLNWTTRGEALSGRSAPMLLKTRLIFAHLHYVALQYQAYRSEHRAAKNGTIIQKDPSPTRLFYAAFCHRFMHHIQWPKPSSIYVCAKASTRASVSASRSPRSGLS